MSRHAVLDILELVFLTLRSLEGRGFPNTMPVALRLCLFSQQPEVKGTFSSELLPLIISVILVNAIYGPPY